MVKVYTKTICPKCMVAKSFFKSNDIEIEEVNIDQDEEARQKLIDLGFMAAPIVEHDSKFYLNMGEFQELADQLK